MSIPKLYTVLPKKEGSHDIESLTSLSSEIVSGSDSEEYVVLSYFPKTLRYSKLNSFIINKYVLFVLEETESADYSVIWDFDLFDNEDNVVHHFAKQVISLPGEFEYTLSLLDTSDYLDMNQSELTLKISCSVSKNGVYESTMEVEQTILPIEADFLSENAASTDESEHDPSAVHLGNEETTHFVRGHLSEYLAAKQESLNPSRSESPNNAAEFIYQTTARVYNNLLGWVGTFKPYIYGPPGSISNNYFSEIFVDEETETAILLDNHINNAGYMNIGICSLNLHHVLPIIIGEEHEHGRVDSPDALIEEITSAHDNHHDEYIIAYHRSVFPKSAISLSVDIFDKLFIAFQAESTGSSPIYETWETSPSGKNAKIEAWKDLSYSELSKSANDRFMKNLIAEHYAGYYKETSPFALSWSNPEGILRIDGSQFIQKLLSASEQFSLEDFLTTNVSLAQKVGRIFNALSAHDRVAQMLMPAATTAYKMVDGEPKPDFTRDGPSIPQIETLLAERKIGGILMLIGTKDQFSRWSRDFAAIHTTSGALPLLISADAEPSLINGKIRGLDPIRKANQTSTLAQVEETAIEIYDIIREYGINYNFAPVVDVGKNKTAGYRSFASVLEENNIPFAKKFIETMQDRNIIATAKHFPGHGKISGDTHKGLQVIKGEFQEVQNYPPLIEFGILSIMTAHIAVEGNSRYNTGGAPSTLSKTIVTDLLRNELGFKGLIVTDGMNMGAVKNIPNLYVKAVEAGVDIIEIPVDPSQAHSDILTKYNADSDFKGKVDKACKRIIRMKSCLGLI